MSTAAAATSSTSSSHFVGELPETNVASLVLGLAAMVIIIVARRIDRRIPGPLIAVVGAIVIATAMDLTADGVAVVGDISGGLSTPSLPAGRPR